VLLGHRGAMNAVPQASRERTLTIVGGGVIGLSVAWYARQAGFAVTVVERGGPPHDSCSLGNAGMVVPSHFVPLAAPGMVATGLRSIGRRRSPVYVRPRLDAAFVRWSLDFWRSANRGHVARSAPVLRDLALLSRRCYEELATARGNDFGLEKHGLVMLCRTEHGLHEEIEAAKHAERLGLEARVLDAAGLAALEPAMRTRAIGGVHYPLDCHLSPQKFVAGLTRDLEAAGARFVWNAEATGWRVEGRRGGERVVALETTAGDFAADEYVLAAGSWSPRTVRGLDLRLPIEAGKGYSLTLAAPRAVPRTCAILVEARIAVTPMQGTLRFAGTMELSGLDESVDPERVRAIVEAVPEYYPDYTTADFDGVTPWRGLRPCTPDGMPYIGRLRRYANFSVATGHAMMGLSLAPATGRLMAEALAGRTSSMPLDAFAPERFG
jgi:D-amino-acid dehydrogenase